MRTDDGSIIQTCLNDEPEAFGILVDKYKAGIFAYVYARVNNFQDAQEITQDVFLCAYSGLHSLKRYESFSFWLFRIASNRCKRWQRNQIRHSQPEFIDDVDPEAIDNSSIKSHHEETMDQSVREALNTLPETYREVLLLYYFSDMDSKEIADSLGISPTAIRMRLSRAREHFKEEMIAMMGTAFENQRLHASFTFKIVEAIKRIKVQPISQTKGLPWGISLATGLIATVLAINPHLIQFNWDSLNSFLSSSSKAKVLEFGEFPVNILDTSQIPNLSNGMSDSKGSEQFDMQNALFIAPQAEEGTWRARADMLTARLTFSTSVANGKIYAMGGSSPDSNILAFPNVEEYDPNNNIWIKKADMPHPRYSFSTSIVNGKIYAIGGTNSQDIDLYSSVDEYDPKMDKWTKKANMPTGRHSLSTCVVRDKIYAIGGRKIASALSTVEEYDPKMDKWTKRADMPTTRFYFCIGVVNNKIYAIGGTVRELEKDVLSIVEEYDPITDKWARKADMPTARFACSASVVNGKIYVIGGAEDPSFQDQKCLKIVEEYDPQTNTWTRKSDMPTERAWLSTSAVSGKIYAMGGGSSKGVVSTVEEYDTGYSGESVNSKGKLPNTWGKLKTK